MTSRNDTYLTACSAKYIGVRHEEAFSSEGSQIYRAGMIWYGGAYGWEREWGRVNKSRIVLASIYPARTVKQPTDYKFRAGLSGCTHIFCAAKKFKTGTSLPALIIFRQETKTHQAVRILLLPYINAPASLTVRWRRWTVLFAGCNTNSSGGTCKFTWGDSSPLCFQSIRPTDNPLTQYTLRKI